MHVEYDISEQDFLHALRLVHRRTTPTLVRWIELASPFLGFALLIFIIYRIATQGMSGISALGLGIGFYLLFTPSLSKNRQKQLYRNSDFLHRRLILEVDKVGLWFGGQTGTVEMSWMSIGRCIEDQRAFLVLSEKGRAFQVVPKRCLSSSQVSAFRECLRRRSGPDGLK
jgi:YcxB-like protein